MTATGLEIFLRKPPSALSGKRIGVLCHAPSITPDFTHITEHFFKSDFFRLTAVFGPQHGLFGQTQDNMIEWEGHMHPILQVPVFSLYGEFRKPSAGMLNAIDALIIDIQDVGARLYTYVWTMKLCMEACSEAGLPVWVLDRPNPVAGMWYDGPMLREEFFTFVGGASIPLCHRMTAGEIAVWLKEKYFPGCILNVIPMKGWKRRMMYDQTGLPWVLPSPNMPTVQTATVYPGMVLLEALNISEGRGTTIPFELFGAPWINSQSVLADLRGRNLKGCRFRIHPFIPTFNKYRDILCDGLQVHVTDIKAFRPVETAMEIIDSVRINSPEGSLKFNNPPYEYENNLIPFDILSGDDGMRKVLASGKSLRHEKERWKEGTELFRKEFRVMSLYGDC